VKKRILIIDDEEAVRKSFALALEDLPYQVDCAENGKIGIIETETFFIQKPFSLKSLAEKVRAVLDQ